MITYCVRKMHPFVRGDQVLHIKKIFWSAKHDFSMIFPSKKEINKSTKKLTIDYKKSFVMINENKSY